MRLDIIVLVIGLVFLLAAVVLTVMVRRAIRPRIVARREFNRHELTNRLKQMLPDAHRPPADTTPAMVSTLNGQGVSAKDVNLSLIDLATRGYLCISPLNERKDSWRDWVFTKVADADDQLLPYERTLVEAPFAGKDSVTHSRMLLSANKPLELAHKQLIEELRKKDWVEGDEPRSSVWGVIGGVLLLAGLVLTAAMIFDWLTTSSMFGLIGAIALAAAGGVVASLGSSWYRPESMEAVAKHLERFKHQTLDQKIKASSLARSFSQDAPWAISLGIQEQLAQKYEDFLASHSRCNFELDWYKTPNPISPAEVLEDLSQLVSEAD